MPTDKNKPSTPSTQTPKPPITPPKPSISHGDNSNHIETHAIKIDRPPRPKE